MVSISTISNTTQTVSTANSTAAASTTTAQTTTVATPTITTTNSSTVKVSAAALSVAKAATATPTPLTVAQILATGDKIPAGTVIKDTAANISTNLKALASLTSIANVTSITLSDTKAGTISVARTDLVGDLSDPQNTDLNLAVLKKITSSYTLNVSGLSVSDALTLKAPAKTATLSLSISDTVDNVSTNLTALQTAAKAKSIAGIAISPATAGSPKPNLTLTAAQLKASPELLATIKGDYDLTITGVAAADAVTVAGNADKVLRASGSQSTQSKIAISDTASNLVKSIAALETAATAGRLTSITVSDSKALVLTEAQIKADSHFLATQFTSNTSIEATAVAAADVTTVQSLVNANSKLTLTKESIADTAANIQSNLDNLEAQVKAGGKTPSSPTPTGTISPFPPAPLAPNQVYNPSNGHVYEYVAHSGISWETAKAEADAQTYAGVSGYLTTITSQEEFDFIENHVIPNGPNSDNTYIGGHLASGSNTKWQWSDGPENGTAFWDNGAITGQYANFSQYGYPKANSNGSEPALAMNGYFLPGFNTVLGIPIGPQGSGNTGYVIEYSGFPPAPTPKANALISNITATDKGSITVTNSTLVNDIDALKVLTGKYTLNVTDIGVSDALALKAPSKDATLSISVKDTAANIAANWDKLQAAVKAKTITAITVTDNASSLLTMTAAQLKADADALKLVTGDYKLSVTGVAAADVAKTLTTKNIYSVEVKDTAANILKNLTSIQTAVTAAKIQNVVITDAANPALSISDIFALTTTLPNVTLATGVKFNVKDTANMIIAHGRDDIGDVLKNAGTVTLTDKTPPNLTLADAITLKGIANLATGTKYNVTDGGTAIATQAAITGETVLSGAASVSINKNFNINDAKAVTGIKTLAKGTVYSIADTADNVLAQSAVAGDKILAGANTVTVVDTSANIIAKLDQLEVLAKAGKIADIKFTDTPSAALNITNDQLVKDAEAIGKIISQRTFPVLTVTKPATPKPLLPLTTAPTTFEFNLPAGATAPSIKGLSEFNNKMWGEFTTATGSTHLFYSNTDATGFADISNLLPTGSTNFDVNGFNSDGSQLWGFLTNKDGARQAFLVYPPNQGQAYNPDLSIFSNDGSKLAGISSDPALNKQIMIINNDGSNFKLISVPNVISIHGFSPDGTTLLGQYRGNDSYSHIFTIKTDGSGFKDLSPPAPVEASLGEYQGGFSVDGKSIWGTFSNPQGVIKSFAVGIDGNNYTDLTPPNMTTAKFFGLHPTQPFGLGLYKSSDGKDHLIATSFDNKTSIEYKTPNGETIYFEGLGAGQNQIRGYYYPSTGQQIWSNQHACTINLDGTGFVDLNPTYSTYTNTNGGSVSLYGNLLFGIYGTLDGKNHAFSVNANGTGFIDLTPNAMNAKYDAQTPSRTFASGTYQTSDNKWHGFAIDLTKSNSAIINLINGMGGSDKLIGSNSADYFEMDGFLNMYRPDEGLIGSPEGTIADGNAGDDMFHYYTNHNYFGNASTWFAPSTTINGGNGTDSILINGESIGAVKIWDLTKITMSSIEKLVLAWDPPNSNLTVNLTEDQYIMLSKIIVLPSNGPSNLTITVNGTTRSEAISKVSPWDGVDYTVPNTAKRYIGTGASGEVIDASK